MQRGFTNVSPRITKGRFTTGHQGFSNGLPTVHQVCTTGPRYFQQFVNVCAMLSALDAARRSLVKLLRATATKYQTETSVSRESSDKDVAKAFRTVWLRAHPDKGGDKEGYQKLILAYERRRRQTETERHRQTNSQTDRHTDRQTDRQTGRQTDRQTGKQTDRQQPQRPQQQQQQ